MLFNKTLELSDYQELQEERGIFAKYYEQYGPWMLVSVEHRFWEYSLILKILKSLLTNGGKLLEVGSAASSGQGTPLAAVLAIEGYDVTCSDLSDDGRVAVDTQNSLFPDIQFPLKWSSEDATHLSFPSTSFDGVYSISVIEHIQNDEDAIAEAIRVLRPGGIFTFTCDFSNIQTQLLSGQCRLYTEEYINNKLRPIFKDLGMSFVGQQDFSKNEENVVYEHLRYNFAVLTLRK